LAPTTLGGQEVLFWPRIPTSAVVVQYASATQGTKRGDASIAWEFLNLPEEKSSYDSAVVKVNIRVLVPPGSTATLRLPSYGSGVSIKYAERMPDLGKAKSAAARECAERRKAGMGFDYNWEYNRTKQEWNKFHNGKAIGTPCRSYLFSPRLEETQWSHSKAVAVGNGGKEIEVDLDPGFYDVLMDQWKLTQEIEDKPGYSAFSGDLGSYCSDPDTYSWKVTDATHLI